jgi:hypothetical protein
MADSAIEVSFVASVTDGKKTYAVLTRRHIEGSLWSQTEALYEGQNSIEAINCLCTNALNACWKEAN